MERGISWLGRESLSDDERRHALAHELGVPFVQLGRDDISVEALDIIPEPLAREHNLVAYALSAEGGLQVALLDLSGLEHLDFLRPRYRVLPRLTTRESLTRALIRYQQHLRDLYGKKLEDSAAPNLLDTLLRHALHSRATDLHLQSDSGGLLARYRINGSLKNAMTLPQAAGVNVMAKLRTLANLPASTLPREGRLRVDLGNGEDLSIRVASVPTVAGEKLVLRIARERARGFTLESLGFHGEALERVHQTLLKRRGLVLVTGGAGAGKSTALYTMLDLLNTPELSIATIEEPVKHVLPRVAQTEVGIGGLTAAAALRAALKADPDVVMINTIVDHEIAALAAAAASRGIFVLAGVEDTEFLPDAELVITVTTVRKLGDKQIPERHKLTRAQGEQLEAYANFGAVLAALKEERKVAKDTPWKDVQFVRPVKSTEQPDGYKGLLGVQEVATKEGTVGLNLIEDGVFKAAQGLTSIEEVLNLLSAS
jgi:type IV pilus assembly protein PilB